jgi:uncharacterized protein (DUF1697 family)
VPRYFAFLRAVNVGGRVVMMDQVQAQFEALGLAEVSTFLASGNVIFTSPRKNPAVLETEIEERLAATLGYEVPTILRTEEELARIAAHEPFPRADLDAPGHTLYVTLLKAELSDEARGLLPTFETPADALCTHRREIYRLCRGRISESTLPEPAFARAMGVPGTARNMNTIRRLVARGGSGPADRKRGGRA